LNKKGPYFLLWGMMCLGLLTTQAQTHLIDSLNQAAYAQYRENVQEGKALAYKALMLAEEAKAYVGIVDAHVNLGRCFRFTGQWDSAYLVLEQATLLSQAEGYEQGLMNAVNNLGLCYSWQGKDKEAKPLFTRALHLAQKIGDLKGQANAYNNLFIIVSEDLGKSDSAFLLLQKALDVYRVSGDSVGIARVYSNKAFLLDDLQQKDSAIHYNFEALYIQEFLGLSHDQAASYNQIGVLYTEKGKYREALDLHEKALSIFEKIGDVSELAVTHLSISSALLLLKKSTEAFPHLEKSLMYSRKTGDVYMIGNSLLEIANWHIKQDRDYTRAQAIYGEAIEALTEANSYNLSSAYDGLGTVALEQNKFTEAKNWFEKELETAKAFLDLKGQYYALKNLVPLYEQAGDIRKALAYQKRFQQVSDSLNSQASLATLNRLNIEFESEKKEKENLQLKYDLSQSELQASKQRVLRNQIMGVALVTLLLGLGGFIWYRYRQRIRIREQQMALEHERARKEQRRKEAEKLRELDAMKTRFFTNISHEFRTPLTLILGQNEQFRQATLDPSLLKKLEVSQRNGHRLLDLVNQVLDVAKLEAGGMDLDMTRLDVIPFLKHMLYSFESIAQEKEISLSFASTIETLETAFDTQKIERVLFNLLSNALKFTPAGGKVEMQVTQADDALTLMVRDSGLGIKSSQLPYIFDRFYQADSSENQSQPGTGIGLSLVKELIELHQGRVEVQSEVGQGTTFLLTLPIPADLTPYPVQVSAASLGLPVVPVTGPSLAPRAPVASTRQEQVLLIEDNADVRAFVKEQIMGFGYQVQEAKDGQEGLEKARDIIPDLVISDIMMPRLDGYGVAKGMKEDSRTSHIPLILLTSKASDESRISGLELGIDDYLLKPFHAKELEVRMQNLIAQRKRLRERFSSATIIRPNEVSAVSMDQAFLKQVLDSIQRNLGNEQFGVEILASEVGMSANHLNRKLGALVDQTAGKLIRSMRLQRAADLLRQQAGNVSEIAFELGFNSHAAFARSFKQQFGMSPSAYQKQGEEG